jgi:hypothetical protein
MLSIMPLDLHKCESEFKLFTEIGALTQNLFDLSNKYFIFCSSLQFLHARNDCHGQIPSSLLSYDKPDVETESIQLENFCCLV